MSEELQKNGHGAGAAGAGLVAEGASGEGGGVLKGRKAAKEFSKGKNAIGRKVPLWVKLVIAAVLVLAALVSLCLGKYYIAPVEIPGILWGVFVNWCSDTLGDFGTLIYNIGESYGFDFSGASEVLSKAIPHVDVPTNEASVLVNVRIPRIIVVMLVGAALSVAGASYQGMFKNPLVSPDVLGASAGASFGACLALLLDMPAFYVSLFAFIGAMAAVGCAVWTNKLVNKADALLGLVLGGMLVSSLFQSFVSLIKFMADSNDKLPALTFWLMGSFSRIDNGDIKIAIPILVGFFLIWIERWNLNVMSFGEREAKTLGVNVKRTRLVVIFASTLVVGCSVAVAGIVGWVGLVIPHLARAIVGPNYKALVPTSIVIGAAYLLLVDNFCRLIASVEIPIGILTAIIGVPVFVYIFRRNTKGW
jgi:iron complex transport system permease protein